jgi:LysR family transcriptional regulator, regulator for genes of the gallate degradation pathway
MSLTPFDLNLRHIRAVAAIARNRGISPAAIAVSLSQPALTQGLARLEQHLGTRLFERRADGMVPTAAGEAMALRSVEIFDHLERALKQGRGTGRGFVRPEQLLTMAQLRALLALSDAGSFVSAAAQTGLSQPALHRAVRDVERLVGVPLVERRGRGVAMTEAGRRAARGFRIAIGALQSALAEIAAVEGVEALDEIVVGAMPLSRARLLPEAITAFRATHSQAHVRVIEGSHRELTDQLRDGRLDLTLGALRDPPPGPDVHQKALMIDRLAIVARAGHPLAEVADAKIESLAAFDWVIGLPATPLRRHWEALFDGRPLPPAPIECGSVMAIRGLLMASDMLTLLSPDQVGLELETGLLTLVGGPLERSLRTIGVTVRTDWRPTGAQRAFLAEVERIAQQGLPENQ